ncbi:MAG TPA: sigma-70 family RNA polymerase sigma factor [Acidobacteriota bacterium]|nr:sigma-70 family RNA polymerase sigma factor [Acidobacteriota bacterium]
MRRQTGQRCEPLARTQMYPDEIALTNYEDKRATSEPISVLEGVRSEVTLTFEELFERYSSMVFHLTCRILGDREEALDVSQEVFLTVYRKMSCFRGESSLKTWIYRIAVNRASNRCRWWNRLRRRGTVSLDEHLSRERVRDISETLESGGKSPEETLLIEEERAEIERSLIRLPVQQRIAVVMRDIDGLTYEEIAESLQVSLGTVKSRIARGREELKRRLNGTLG